MKRAIHPYKGLTSDIARDTISKGFYIDALDIRITTDTGESQGCITNIRGNKLYFSLPTTDFEIGVTGTMEIIGATSIRNVLILFTADDSDTNGWIWKIEYADDTQAIIGSLTLIYKSNELNFSKKHPIEAFGRFETGGIQRVYWTDYEEYLRSLNIEDPNVATTDVGLIDIFPNVQYTQPLLTNVLGGGALLAGSNQYAYRLITADGKETLISPPGNMIHTVQDLETELQDRAYSGNAQTVNTGKSLEITIDTSLYGNFKYIELIHILHEDPTGTPQIFSVEQKEINNQATVVFVHTGLENTIEELTLDEYTFKAYPFKTAKTITQKDSSLVVANIKGSGFDIQELLASGDTFDAKTKRYNSSQATEAGKTDLELAFNESYNKDAHWEKDWHDNSQFKYQSDGARLGGEGANITYNFHVEKFLVDNTSSPDFSNLNDLGSLPVDLNDGYGNYANNTWSNHASPFISGLLRGYKRGETYRFGIIFYNKKGEASFVEYIGDIKFPDVSEEDSVANDSGTSYFPLSREETAGNTYAYAMGIEFTLDFSSCPSLLAQVESYQIVRLKREEADTKRLCSGIMKIGMKFDITSDSGGGGATAPNNGYTLAGPSDNQDILHLFTYHQNRDSADVVSGEGHGINANFGTLNNRLIGSQPFEAYGAYLTFYSPEISFDFENTMSYINSNACLLMTGRYGQYYSAIDAATSTVGVAQEFVTNNVKEGVGVKRSFDIIHSQPASTENLGEKMEDHRRMLRSVGQVDKDTSTKAIEYVKKWGAVQELRFDNTKQDDPLMTVELAKNLGPYVGFNDAGSQVTRYFRNFYAYLGNTLPGLNDHSDGGQDFLSIFHKGATGITGCVEKIDVDPLTGAGVSVPVATNYFDTGASIGAGPVRAVVNEAPLNKTLTNENYTSTPLLDILIPRQEVYGGFSQDALESNFFMPASPVIDTANLNPKVFGGDMFLCMFDFQESAGWLWDIYYQNASGGTIRQEFDENRTSSIAFVTESRINLNLSYGSTVKRGVEFDVSGGPSGILDQIWRQETNNSTSTWGKRNSAGQYNMYIGVYNGAYSLQSDDLAFVVKPDSFDSDSNVNDIRAYISGIKINGEIIDSWTQFGVNDYYDVDDYGPINKIVNYKDEVYFFQDKAVGRYSINPRAVTSTTDGIETELGSAEGIKDHTYLSNKHGSIHQWSVKDTDAGIYYFDGIHKKIFKVSQGNNPLSEMKAIHGLLKNFKGPISYRKENDGDNPILGAGVHTTRDRINNEVIFTFLGTWTASPLETNTLYSEGEIVEFEGVYYLVNTTYTSGNDKFETLLQELQANSTEGPKLPNDRITLVFDEIADQFSTRFSATPPVWIENGDILLSSDPNEPDHVYIHNKGNWGEFYGEREEMSIRLVLNENADINKILRTIEFNSIVRDGEKNIDRTQTITGFRVETEYQDTGKTLFASGRIKRRFDKWRLRLPRDINNPGKDRLRSTYFVLTLYFDNTANREIILDRILYYYDIQIF